jgi:DNA-binding Lrp family transcriptional regulator
MTARTAKQGKSRPAQKGDESAEAHGPDLDRFDIEILAELQADARLGVFAFVRVDAERNTGSATRLLEEAIRRLPEVTACHYISGAGTFELQVMATDLDAFSRFATETLLNLPNVKDIHTSFSLGEVKAGGALPLTHLRASRGRARS